MKPFFTLIGYDDGYIRANEMLSQFTEQDWQKLAQFLPLQNEEWQRICFEGVAEDNSVYAQGFILQFLDDENTFLQYQAIDTLNEQLANNFLSEKQKEFFSNNLLRIDFPQNNLSVNLLLASIFNELNQ